MVNDPLHKLNLSLLAFIEERRKDLYIFASGRLNQANLFIKRFGVFFGQCSEICGVNHGFMPIVLLAMPSVQYHYLIMNNLEFN